MARKRGEPAIPGTGKELLEPPVYPSFPKNTPKTTPPSEESDGTPGKVPDRDTDREGGI
ncbi:hypothetical protein [Persicitalea jodogahamensis]|uniref:hypothetical protein n=1 Tax=Persicitalea jodogahamensis TaxID=402147 RepID=UPI001679C4A2|nr:hypothetical protein [Persicitalea jodogahamensis]